VRSSSGNFRQGQPRDKGINSGECARQGLVAIRAQSIDVEDCAVLQFARLSSYRMAHIVRDLCIVPA
jgi:hypothetical protein